jgi:hypothetical protein
MKTNIYLLAARWTLAALLCMAVVVLIVYGLVMIISGWWQLAIVYVFLLYSGVLGLLWSTERK